MDASYGPGRANAGTAQTLDGEITYRHGNTPYHMKPGDSLFFDADTPHGPEHLTRLPIRFLSIISYPQGGGD